MRILDTPRLCLRTVEAEDAAFYLELVNTPDFIANIGDRNVRTLDDARQAIATGPQAMQHAHGYSTYLVALKACGTPIGMAGLIRRETLDDTDLGYAFLPAWYGQGYAFEATSALLPYARRRLGLTRLVAIVSPQNDASNALLRKLGMRFERVIYMAPGDPGTRLYGMNLA